MAIKNKGKPVPKSAFWRRKYEKQELLINAIISLLNKYGSSMELHGLYREFLHTMMGHYLVTDACYFALREESEALTLAVSYGSIRDDRLAPIRVDSQLVSYLLGNRSSLKLADLPKTVLREPPVEKLRETMVVLGPVCLKDKLLGIMLLGEKIASKRYSEFDLELLSTLCTASAVCFNNLFENAKSSLQELFCSWER